MPGGRQRQMKIDPRTETVDTCLICSTRDHKPDNWFERELGLVPPYGIVRCVDCGLRWLSPRPTAEAIMALYSEELYFDGPNAVESYAALAEKRRPYFSQRIKRIESHFQAGRKLSILDVGAATGEFVVEAIRRGHRADGIELSEHARRKARLAYGIELLHQSPADLAPIRPYDVIHLNHVFEHLPDPVSVLHDWHRVLDSEGMLVIEVPQQFDNDLDRLKRFLRIRKKPQFNAYSLHHTFFFLAADADASAGR
jgi:SAM-dependent methyltransferase